MPENGLEKTKVNTRYIDRSDADYKGYIDDQQGRCSSRVEATGEWHIIDRQSCCAGAQEVYGAVHGEGTANKAIQVNRVTNR